MTALIPTALIPATADRRNWAVAGATALAVHLGAGALALAWMRPADLPVPVPEPVVVIELPPEAAPPPAAASAPQAVMGQAMMAQAPAVPITLPPVRTALPANAVTLPLPAPQQPAHPPAAPSATPQSASAPAAAPAPTGAGTGTSAAAGNDPRARQREADYFALVSAHLNRRKTYPAEARQARQHGVVTVRFTVDRGGGVSGVSIKRSSGHELLDRATLDLLRRVAPLPRMPAAMPRDSVTLSLPIDYSLLTS